MKENKKMKCCPISGCSDCNQSTLYGHRIREFPYILDYYFCEVLKKHMKTNADLKECPLPNWPGFRKPLIRGKHNAKEHLEEVNNEKD
jgi:hypothetical protein